jgi:hypothetical protein
LKIRLGHNWVERIDVQPPRFHSPNRAALRGIYRKP